MIKDDNLYTIDQMKLLIERVISGVNKYLKEGKPRLILDGIEVKLPESSNLVDYVGKKTYQSIIRVKYHTDAEGSKTEVAKLELPILIEGIYVVDGKCKLPLNYMNNDTKCLIGADKIILNSEICIDIKSDSPLRVKDEESNKFVPVNISEMDEEVLKLDPYTAKKLAILYGLEGTPEYLTEELLQYLVVHFNKGMRDNALNKVIITPSMALIRNIRILLNEGGGMREIRGKYYQSFTYKKTAKGKLYLKSIQNAINDFFTGNDEFFTGIQNPSISNPLIFESMKNKVIFETRRNKRTKKSKISYTRFDSSFYGLIDPTQTPDNSNTSRVNELTRCVVVKNGTVYIKCMTPDFLPTEVEYIDYINSKVLTSEQVIYELNELTGGAPYHVKYRFKMIESPDFDYIELSPDWRLSLTGAQVPMVNLCDSVRVAMGGKMINQAIGVIGGELPLVSSGNDSLSTNLIVESDVEGEIIDNKEGRVLVKTPDGDIRQYDVPNPINGYNQAQITFKPGVSVGQKVNKGDTLIKPDTIDERGRLKVGINARTAMMTYRGYNFEDGVIVSESLAAKFTSVTTEIITIEISPEVILDGYVDVGTRLKSPDYLMQGRQMKRFKGKSQDLRKELGLSMKYSTPWSVRLPNDMPDVLVYDMKVAKGDVESKSEETEYLLAPDGRIRQIDKKLDELDFDYDYDQSFIKEFKATEGSAYTIKYKLLVFHKLKNQDKLSNRYGSKGVVSLILPDDQMPYDADGNIIECIMNPDAPLSRKNIPQTIELNLTVFVKAVKARHKEMLDQMMLPEIRQELKKYMMYDYYKMSDEELTEFLKSDKPYQYVTGSFSRLNPKILSEWMDELGISSKIQLWDGVTHKKIRNPIMVSDMYLIKLYFMSNVYAKVTSASYKGTEELVMGQGSITRKGSKHGNMEMDAILANDIMEYAKDQKQSEGDSPAWMLANFLITGLMMEVQDEED